ncbi:MAG: hypothetical protein K0R65_1199 [Crocinitomicaceae bacterium]|jgi:F0F1-type ATP synthase assembly protein I|nr:hypothetical protein [Crocinitomicaceae bacterium]
MKINKLCLAVSLLSGAAIMAIEVSMAKMFEPRVGYSITLWSSIIAFTMLGLALGYYLSPKFARFKQYRVALPLAGSLMLSFFSPQIFQGLFGMLEGSGIKMVIFLCSFVLLVPNLLFLGSVSPSLIGLINENSESSGKSAGTIFSISTIGGILACIIFGLYTLPYLGIKFSFMLIAILLLLGFLLVLLYNNSSRPNE